MPIDLCRDTVLNKLHRDTVPTDLNSSTVRVDLHGDTVTIHLHRAIDLHTLPYRDTAPVDLR